MDNIFSAFRIKKTTVNRLQLLKRAFEVVHSQPLSNDYFVEKMMDCVKDQDSEVWAAYSDYLSVEEKHKPED